MTYIGYLLMHNYFYILVKVNVLNSFAVREQKKKKIKIAFIFE